MKMCLLLNCLFLILSCEQDPLKGIPGILQEGVLKTGEQHLPYFEDAFREKLVKISIQGGNNNDSIMEFTEGQTQSYVIQIRFLYDLASKYQVHLSNENFSLLEGSHWSFDREKKRINIEWKPDRTFTRDQPIKKIFLTLTLKLESLNLLFNKAPFFITKKIAVVIYKKLDKPEIYQIKTKYNEYKKLSDGQFYTNHGALFLNLKHYDQIFFGINTESKKKKDIFSSDHLDLYSYNMYNHVYSGSPPGNPRHYGVQKRYDVYDKYNNVVSHQVLKLLKQKGYYQNKLRKSSKDCHLDMTVFVNKKDSFCLAELDSKKTIDFKQELYIKQYKIPDTMNRENLFYKVEDPVLCEIYEKIHFSNTNANQNQSIQTPCYLFVHKAPNFQNRIEENRDIYFFKESQFEMIDKSKWEFEFYKIPDFVQWQMGGYQPLKDQIIDINLIEDTDFHIYVRDYNYLDLVPYLAPLQKEKSNRLFWQSPIGIDWALDTVKLVDNNGWDLLYSLKIKDLEQLKNLNQLEMNFQPISGGIVFGDPISLRFNIFPPIDTKFTKIDDQETKSIEVVNHIVENAEGIKQWLSSIVKLSHKIKVQYVFPKVFLSKLRDIPPFNIQRFNKYFVSDLKNTSDESKEESLLNYLKIFRTYPRLMIDYNRSNRCLLQKLKIKDSEENSFFKTIFCQCSDFVENTKDGFHFIESTCAYEVGIQVDSTKLNFDFYKKIPSVYLSYNYSIEDSKLDLKNSFYESSAISDLPVKLKEDEAFKELKAVGNHQSVHIFFNLIPILKCEIFDDSIDRQTCMIQYSFDNLKDYRRKLYEEQLKLEKSLNKDLKDIGMENNLEFQEKYQSFMNLELNRQAELIKQAEIDNKIQIHVACDNTNQQEKDCSCDQTTVSDNGIEVQCSFQKSKVKSFSIYLKTDNPDIYFLSTDLIHDRKYQYKRTPIKKLTIR